MTLPSGWMLALRALGTSEKFICLIYLFNFTKPCLAAVSMSQNLEISDGLEKQSKTQRACKKRLRSPSKFQACTSMLDALICRCKSKNITGRSEVKLRPKGEETTCNVKYFPEAMKTGMLPACCISEHLRIDSKRACQSLLGAAICLNPNFPGYSMHIIYNLLKWKTTALTVHCPKTLFLHLYLWANARALKINYISTARW